MVKTHYEILFEKMLQEYHVPYLCLREAKRVTLGNLKLKNFDFIVFSKEGVFLAEVKGYGKYYPDTNVSVDDVIGLKAWEDKFKEYTDKVKAIFVFFYKGEDGRHFVKSIDVREYDRLKRHRARYYHKGGTVALTRSLAIQVLKDIGSLVPELK